MTEFLQIVYIVSMLALSMLASLVCFGIAFQHVNNDKSFKSVIFAMAGFAWSWLAWLYVDDIIELILKG